MSSAKKIGLYAGTFDPVHEGHVSLIRQSLEELGLDLIYCLPNRSPPRKQNVTDFIHREEMLKLALSDMDRVMVLRTNTDYATFPETIDALDIADAEVSILMGSDAAMNLDKWRNSQQMIERVSFIVGVRSKDDEAHVTTVFRTMGVDESRYKLITTSYVDHSSSRVRNGQQTIHPGISPYIRKHRLYKV